jgi:replicative DNA helicase
VSERVVELPSQASRPAPEFERTPPAGHRREQSVLGGMLLSKDAIADVVEVVRATDFYRPAHQTIFDVVVDLYGRGEPADPITVSAELTRLGEIGRVGGAPYLHTLLSSVPTAANAGFYAKIVAEQAVLRRLVEAGTRIVQLGYGAAGTGGVDDVVDRPSSPSTTSPSAAAARTTRCSRSSCSRRWTSWRPSAAGAARCPACRPASPTSTGLTNGLHAGQLIVIAGRPGLGKALALDTPLPTPTGWTTMGEVAVGDLLLDADGRPTRVVAATPVLTGRPCYEVVFSDGTRVVADAGHQWLTETRASRRSPSLRPGPHDPGAGRDGPLPRPRRARQPQRPDGAARCSCRRPTSSSTRTALGVWLAAGPRRSPDEAEIALRLESVPPTRRPTAEPSEHPRRLGSRAAGRRARTGDVRRWLRFDG